MMEEVMINILTWVGIAAISTVAGFVCYGLKKFTAWLSTKIQNEQLKNILNEAANAVTTAVSDVSQTYVDDLKKKGIFDANAHETALNLAKEKAKTLMASATQNLIEELYGGIDNWLTAQIEATVHDSKNGTKTLIQ